MSSIGGPKKVDSKLAAQREELEKRRQGQFFVAMAVSVRAWLLHTHGPVALPVHACWYALCAYTLAHTRAQSLTYCTVGGSCFGTEENDRKGP